MACQHSLANQALSCKQEPEKMTVFVSQAAGIVWPANAKKKKKQKVTSWSEIVPPLQNKSLISDSCAELLETTFSGVRLQLMK